MSNSAYPEIESDLHLFCLIRYQHLINYHIYSDINLHQVVQSIVSLTKPLVQDLLSLTILTKSILGIFFAEKM